MNSSQSTAIEIAWRSLRVRSELPPTVESSQLKPRYRIVVSTEVRSRMPRCSISGVRPASPSIEMRTACGFVTMIVRLKMYCSFSWFKTSIGVSPACRPLSRTLIHQGARTQQLFAPGP